MRMLQIAALSCALALVSCTKLERVDWPDVVRCGPTVTDIVGVVSDILLDGQDYHDRLERLARERGYDAVLCVVDELRQAWTSPGAAAHPTRTAAANRADAFIADTGAVIVRE